MSVHPSVLAITVKAVTVQSWTFDCPLCDLHKKFKTESRCKKASIRHLTQYHRVTKKELIPK